MKVNSACFCWCDTHTSGTQLIGWLVPATGAVALQSIIYLPATGAVVVGTYIGLVGGVGRKLGAENGLGI